MVARWRLIAADDPTDVQLGPEVRITYARRPVRLEDADRRDRARPLVRGLATRSASAPLKIGEDAVARRPTLLGVTETEPVDFFIYADQAAFHDALGPGTRENVGGQAIAEIRTLFALITPSQIDDAWVGIVIPHELTHLVFDTASSNPYHFPPRWLNEGLAVYLSQGYDASDRGDRRGAAAERRRSSRSTGWSASSRPRPTVPPGLRGERRRRSTTSSARTARTRSSR